jgi:hypothetical protein
MWFAIQIVLAVMGVVVLLVGVVPLGARTIRNPIASLIGLVLTLALPFTVVLLMILTAAETAQNTEALGLDRAYQLALEPYEWVRPAVLFASLALAGGLAWLGLQQEEELPPLINETINPDALRQRAAEVVASHSTGLTPEPMWSRIPQEDDLPPEVRQFTAPPDSIPDEIAELGAAECLFPAQTNRLSTWWQREPPTSYALFRQAVVAIQGDTFTLIPWSAIQSLTDWTLQTRDGWTHDLNPHVEHAAHLQLLLQQRLASRQSTPAQA